MGEPASETQSTATRQLLQPVAAKMTKSPATPAGVAGLSRKTATIC